jgi:TRAP-type C4-dicarboxylate transport system substrate-binding protein
MKKNKKSVTMVMFLSLLLVVYVTAFEVSAAQEEVTWKFAFHSPENAWGVIHGTEPHLDQIEKATGGKVKIDRYYSQTLVKAADTLEATRRGVVQIASLICGFYPGQFPLTEVGALPLLGTRSSKESSAVSWMLYEKYPEIRKEWEDKNVVVLDFWNCGPYVPMTTKDFGPIRTMKDFKGCKIRTISGPPHKAMVALGASPLYVPMNDLYTSLEKGVVDGSNMVWEAVIGGWKIGEVHKYFTDVPMFYGVETLVVNKDAWEQLEKETQKQIMSVCGLKGSEFHGGQYFDTARQPAIQYIKETEGKEFIEVPTDELKKWQEIGGSPIWNQWVKDMESKGHENAQQILKDALEFAKNYR